jgi:hypothetical protein
MSEQELLDEILELKKEKHTLTLELIGGCEHCVRISSNHDFKTPIYCGRFTGPIHPTCLDVKTCLACGEYKKNLLKSTS